MCCDNILVNVAAYNQELHMQPHLPRLYHNTLL